MTAPPPEEAQQHGEPWSDSRRIVVVGPCASGKSTLVAALRDRGYDARVSGQEHSEIPHLWSRMEPDILIALNVDMSEIHRRRGENWPIWLHEVQTIRLAAAIAAADLLIDTTPLDPTTVIDVVLKYLSDSRNC